MLVDCPECGNKISDKAEACPHCGYPRRRRYQYAILIIVIIFALISMYYSISVVRNTNMMMQL